MMQIKNLKRDTSKLVVSRIGYLIYYQNTVAILGRSKLQEDFDAFVAEGFTGSIDDLDVLTHLDDDKWNCNVINLMNMPSAWNQHPKKAKGASSHGKKWRRRLNMAEARQIWKDGQGRIEILILGQWVGTGRCVPHSAWLWECRIVKGLLEGYQQKRCGRATTRISLLSLHMKVTGQRMPKNPILERRNPESDSKSSHLKRNLSPSKTLLMTLGMRPLTQTSLSSLLISEWRDFQMDLFFVTRESSTRNSMIKSFYHMKAHHSIKMVI